MIPATVNIIIGPFLQSKLFMMIFMMSKVPTITNCPLILIPCFLDCSHERTLRFWASQVAQWWRILLQCKKLGFSLWVGKIPWRKKWQPTPVFLPVKSHGQKSLEGYSPWGRKRIGQNWAAKQQHCAFYSPCSKRAPVRNPGLVPIHTGR